jgi:hypothetical protein
MIDSSSKCASIIKYNDLPMSDHSLHGEAIFNAPYWDALCKPLDKVVWIEVKTNKFT